MQGRNIWMAALQLLEFSPMPHASPSARAGHLLVDHCVAQLVVQNSADPTNSRRLKQLPGHNNSALADIARREHPFLAPRAPHDAVAIQLRSIGKELMPEAAPYLCEEAVAAELLAPRHRSGR